MDCTVGQGGLARRILEASAPDGVLVGIDRDADAIAAARKHLEDFQGRVRLMHGHFVHLKSFAREAGVTACDGIVFDLGVSSAQLDDPARGFSFTTDGPLDMRMDQRSGRTAAEVVQTLSESQLADLIFRYGEERYARRIARAIVRHRARTSLQRTAELVAIIRDAVPASYRHGRIHCATRTFQALRIAVNQELEHLEKAFEAAVDVLAPGGRLCIVSFHSLEDRLAKHTIRRLSQGPEAHLTMVSRKPVVAAEAERSMNPRARSAKLRIAERCSEGRCP